MNPYPRAPTRGSVSDGRPLIGFICECGRRVRINFEKEDQHFEDNSVWWDSSAWRDSMYSAGRSVELAIPEWSQAREVSQTTLTMLTNESRYQIQEMPPPPYQRQIQEVQPLPPPPVPRAWPEDLGLSHAEAVRQWRSDPTSKVSRPCDVDVCENTPKQYHLGMPVVTCKHHWSCVAVEDPEMCSRYEKRVQDFAKAPASP